MPVEERGSERLSDLSKSHGNWQTRDWNPDPHHSKSKEEREEARRRAMHVKNNSDDPDSSKLFRSNAPDSSKR